MVRKGQLKIILIFLLSTVFYLFTQSQNRKYFIITGIIIPESEYVDSSSVQIIRNNKQLVTSLIPQDGRFRLELEYNTECRLIFNRKGHQPKTILVNTDVPEEVNNRPNNFPHFLMAVMLLKSNPDSTNLITGNQIPEISYSPQKDCFAKVPNIPEAEFVEKSFSNQNQSIGIQELNSKMQAYQVF